MYRDKSFTYQSGKVFPTDERLVYQQPYMEVPCGKCVECKRTQYSSYLQRMQCEALTSYMFMITYTYDDAHLPSLRFNTPDGVQSLYYADIKHVQDMFKRVRKAPIFTYRDFRYFAVTEYGTEKFRPHHHILLFLSKLDSDNDATPFILERTLFELFRSEWVHNVGSKRSPIYEPLFTYAEKFFNGKLYRNYDLHYVHDDGRESDEPAVISSCRYLLSYLLKPSSYENTLSVLFTQCERYLPEDISRKIKSVLRSRVYFSKHLGFGFTTSNGRKVMPYVQYARCNSFSLEFWQTYKNLPSTVEEFQGLYPDVDLVSFRKSSFNRVRQAFEGFRDFFNDFVPADILPLSAMFKYDRSFFKALTECYELNTESFNINMFPVRDDIDDSFKSSVSYRFLRSCVDSSNFNNLPYIGFVSNDRWLPMCKYFKRYCCTQQDYLDWLNRLRVKCVDDIHFESSWRSTSTLHSVNKVLVAEKENRKNSNYFRKITPNNKKTLKNICRNRITYYNFVPTSDTIFDILT